jgi:hypothetical protein
MGEAIQSLRLEAGRGVARMASLPEALAVCVSVPPFPTQASPSRSTETPLKNSDGLSVGLPGFELRQGLDLGIEEHGMGIAQDGWDLFPER